MSGGSHNPNGRQAQLAPAWSPLQLQVASYLARAPQVHLAERGVTWHTPTPPPHLYHVPAPSSPDPLQAMKASVNAANSVFRHTATPPDLYRHTPTPPDKHKHRHTPSPGDVKGAAVMPPTDLYQHLGVARDKELLYSRAGVDLSLGRAASCSPANGAPLSLSVRDAPTINSLIARAPPPAPAPRPPHTRVDALLERLAPASPHSPHSVIVHHHAHTPSPPDSNEDSADSCGATSNIKRKRKPERTVRLPAVPPRAPVSPAPTAPPEPRENGRQPHPAARSASCETIDDIAAMIASTDRTDAPAEVEPARADEEPAPDAPAGGVAERLVSVLASPEPAKPAVDPPESPPRAAPDEAAAPLETAAAAPRRRSARLSCSEAGVAPVVSPEEARPAESELPAASKSDPPPAAASFVEVENQLEKMFAGLEPEPAPPAPPTKKKPGRRKSSAVGDGPRRRGAKRKAIAPRPPVAAKRREGPAGRDADSGSNASSNRSRGPYVQVRAANVNVVNAATGEDDGDAAAVRARRKPPRSPRNGLRARGLHGSTLGARYDATTPDVTWVCSFCELGPHAGARDRDAIATRPLGDLFGPYSGDTRCEEYLSLDEAERHRWADGELWMHEDCAVWAPDVVAAGSRTYRLAEGVWRARAARCGECGRRGAGVACSRRGCPARCHVPCAVRCGWSLNREQFRALCPPHARAPP